MVARRSHCAGVNEEPIKGIGVLSTALRIRGPHSAGLVVQVQRRMLVRYSATGVGGFTVYFCPDNRNFVTTDGFGKIPKCAKFSLWDRAFGFQS